MTTVTENDIKQVNEKIDKLADNLTKLTETITSNQQAIETRFNEIEKSQIRLEGKLESLEENFKGDIKALNETIKGIDKRLDNIEILSRIVSGGFIVGILLALVKYLFFSNSQMI
jgi:prophage DNA circulation protein